VHQARSLTRITKLSATTVQELEETFRTLEAEAVADLARENFPPESLEAIRSAGMRYRGQSYEVSVAAGPLRDDADLAELARRFHDAHQRRYGHMAQNEDVEIVNFNVTAIGRIPKPELRRFPSGKTSTPQPTATRRACFGATEPIDLPVYSRDALSPGADLVGPAVVEEKTSTIVIYPGQRAHVDVYLNLEIEAAAP
jgi:N-methylhydantoinase A